MDDFKKREKLLWDCYMQYFHILSPYLNKSSKTIDFDISSSLFI